MLATKPCCKCSKVLGEKEYMPSPHVARKSSSSLGDSLHGPDPFEMEFMVIEKRRSDDVKRKQEEDLHRELTNYIYWDRHPLRHALCRSCVSFMLLRRLRDDTLKLKEKQEAAEDLMAKAQRSASFFAAAATKERYFLAVKEQERLNAELQLLTKQLAEEKQAVAALKQDAAELTKKEEEFAREAMKWRGDKHMYQERWDASLVRLSNANSELALKPTILNDTFHVWGDQPPYFSINGIRMGRKPSNETSEKNGWSVAEGATALPASEYDDVSWKEVNAAWGEACLLLCVLAAKAGVDFKEYELIPRGSKSLVKERRDSVNVYHLYFEGDEGGSGAKESQSAAGALFSLFGFGSSNQQIESFNRAMMGFLVCLKQLSDFARDSPRGNQLNLKSKLYPIKPEAPPMPPPGKEPNPALYMDVTIRGLSIRTTGDPSDARRWTDACMFTLHNVKWITVWAAGATTPAAPAAAAPRSKS